MKGQVDLLSLTFQCFTHSQPCTCLLIIYFGNFFYFSYINNLSSVYIILPCLNPLQKCFLKLSAVSDESWNFSWLQGNWEKWKRKVFKSTLRVQWLIMRASLCRGGLQLLNNTALLSGNERESAFLHCISVSLSSPPHLPTLIRALIALYLCKVLSLKSTNCSMDCWPKRCQINNKCLDWLPGPLVFLFFF